MAEAIGAAATLLSIVGVCMQAFDGCIKGLVMLDAVKQFGRDADILHAQLDWQQYRLEQW